MDTRLHAHMSYSALDAKIFKSVYNHQSFSHVYLFLPGLDISQKLCAFILLRTIQSKMLIKIPKVENILSIGRDITSSEIILEVSIFYAKLQVLHLNRESISFSLWGLTWWSQFLNYCWNLMRSHQNLVT